MYVRFIDIVIEMEGYGSRNDGFCLYHLFFVIVVVVFFGLIIALPCINANMIENRGKIANRRWLWLLFAKFWKLYSEFVDNDFTIQSNKAQGIYVQTKILWIFMVQQCINAGAGIIKWNGKEMPTSYLCVSGTIISAPEFTSIFICSFAYLRFIQSSTQFQYASLFWSNDLPYTVIMLR